MENNVHVSKDILKHFKAWLILYLRPPADLKLPNFEINVF